MSVCEALPVLGLRELEMVTMKRLKVGRDCGTITAWHDGVARIVAKMWMMHACRSVRMTEGNTSAASTSALSEVRISSMASSVIWCRTGWLASARLG